MDKFINYPSPSILKADCHFKGLCTLNIIVYKFPVDISHTRAQIPCLSQTHSRNLS